MTVPATVQNNKRFYFDWIPDSIFRPRRAFQRISSSASAIWSTPLIVLSCLVLINTLVAGRLKNQLALSGEITYPPNYQNYTPEQQAQYNQTIQSTQGPVFVYILPSIISVIGVWIGWLVLGGILHLVSTLLGGRGSTSTSLNIVAWGSIPLALRALIQVVYMLAANKLISSPGLSGFSPAGDSAGLLFISQVLKLIDIYIIWQIFLLVLGVRSSTRLTTPKSFSVVIISVFIILAVQASFSYLIIKLGNLNITRPFFF